MPEGAGAGAGVGAACCAGAVFWAGVAELVVVLRWVPTLRPPPMRAASVSIAIIAKLKVTARIPSSFFMLSSIL
jgi:hypothetical protein